MRKKWTNENKKKKERERKTERKNDGRLYANS